MNKRNAKWKRSDLDITVQSEATGVRLLIEYPDYYEEDYQIPMLRSNEIVHILKIELDGIGKCSRFSYDISGMVSMKKKFDKEKISFVELHEFLKQFLKMVEMLQNHMLETEKLLLEPESIFWGDGVYYFCYLPVTAVPLCEQFHKLTEFFVKQIDYGDMECIFLAHKLNQESMEEQYDVATILTQYYSEANKRKKEKVPSADVIDKEETERSIRQHEVSDSRLIYEDVNTIREMGGFQNQFERIASRMKKKRWGGWEDLILESDRQDLESIL